VLRKSDARGRSTSYELNDLREIAFTGYRGPPLNGA
jgi:hypothetical protein